MQSYAGPRLVGCIQSSAKLHCLHKGASWRSIWFPDTAKLGEDGVFLTAISKHPSREGHFFFRGYGMVPDHWSGTEYTVHQIRCVSHTKNRWICVTLRNPDSVRFIYIYKRRRIWQPNMTWWSQNTFLIYAVPLKWSATFAIAKVPRGKKPLVTLWGSAYPAYRWVPILDHLLTTLVSAS